MDVSRPQNEKMGYRLSYGQIDVDEKPLDRKKVSSRCLKSVSEPHRVLTWSWKQDQAAAKGIPSR